MQHHTQSKKKNRIRLISPLAMLLMLILFLTVLMTYCISVHTMKVVTAQTAYLKEWLKESWERSYTISFTKKAYIPKAVVPTPYPNEYDILIITIDAKLATAGVIVPPPSGSVTIKEAIKNSTGIIEDGILNDLTDQFQYIAKANNWTDLSAGKQYTVTFKLPRRILAEPQQYYLEVNLPAFEVTVYQYYRKRFYPIKTYPCIIGHPDFQTPIMHARIRRMYWNPDWSPPLSGWAKKYNRLEAGGINPLGKAAIELGGYYMLHGTEYPPGQAVSHGCVRMRNEDISELVWFLQNKYDSPCSGAMKAYYMGQLTPAAIKLKKKLPAAVIYAPFLIKNDMVIIAKDVYQKEYFYSANDLKYYLRKNGFSLDFDDEKVRLAVEEGRRSGAKVPIAHLAYDPTPNTVSRSRSFWEAPPPRFSNFAIVTGDQHVLPMTVDLDAVLDNNNAKQKPF